ncbi:hypothetical protein ACP70R_015679 [Stipagrostis hirtigluma subsp. patula]
MSAMMLAMFATMASFYVAGRLWQDAQNRVYLIKELDRRTGQGQSAISVDDTLKVVACRQQGKRLASLEMELAAAKQAGFVGKYTSETSTTLSKKPLIVIGIMTSFGRKNYRDAVRKSWLPTGSMLKKLEEEKGIVVRFIVGRSANRGDTFDREIDDENRSTKDFLILDDHIESDEELPTKTKSFFANAAETFDAAFYAKVNDDIYINLPLNRTHKWYEPDWWKFGDGKSYFRHASGEMFVISRAIAQFISINRSVLRTYAHDDVSVGSWMIGLAVKHVNEAKLCCSSWPSVRRDVLSSVMNRNANTVC